MTATTIQSAAMTANLSMLVRRLCSQLPADNTIRVAAMAFLARHGLSGDEEPSAGQIDEWKAKAADYDRLAGIARNRRHVLEEIAGSKSLTATPQQFADYLQRLAKKACADYTFAGYDDDAALAAPSTPAEDTPAFLKGVSDFERGFKTNPFPFGRSRRGWKAGYEFAATQAAPSTPARVTVEMIDQLREHYELALESGRTLKEIEGQLATQAQASDPDRLKGAP